MEVAQLKKKINMVFNEYVIVYEICLCKGSIMKLSNHVVIKRLKARYAVLKSSNKYIK